MAPQPPITEIDQLKDRPAVAALQAASLVESAKFDRDELTIFVNRADIRGACEILRENPATKYNFLADITCVDVFPSEPRFEVIYNLLSHSRKERLRLIAKVPGGDPSIESLMGLWPSANFFEREVFDLFGVRFVGHPNLRRIMMPEDWEGHPLRKDYPVEGYR
ncbi:MAG: NADH-quinone oxidoreductase subunit C [Acidobacteria bacterium]|nr:MAG: NADH-quinone oxidoreductase subunit C [Acidobacteriota bacterium]